MQHPTHKESKALDPRTAHIGTAKWHQDRRKRGYRFTSSCWELDVARNSCGADHSEAKPHSENRDELLVCIWAIDETHQTHRWIRRIISR